MTLPGFRVFFPDDFRQRSYLREVWRNVALSYGFEEYETPVLEPLDLYTGKVGAEITDQLFHFVDKGGRAVALRPELTASTARLVGTRANSLAKPIKWFNVGDHFRYERMQKGRLRCFTQFNADLFGESGPDADAEIIALLVAIFDRFGLGPGEVVVRLSDRRLWEVFLQHLGFPESRVSTLLQLIDRGSKMKPEAFLESLSREVPERDSKALAAELRAFMGIDSLEGMEALLSGENGDGLTSRLESWRQLFDGLGSRGVADFVRVDLSVVRGLAYYTGFVFEAFPASGEGRALAGGGRYDDLVQKYGGPPLPAVGFGMGDVTLRDLLELRNKLPPLIAEYDAWLVSQGDQARQALLADAAVLRRIGFKVDYPLGTTGGLARQLREADKKGARFAIVYAEEETGRDLVQVKHLSSRQEAWVQRREIPALLRGETELPTDTTTP